MHTSSSNRVRMQRISKVPRITSRIKASRNEEAAAVAAAEGESSSSAVASSSGNDSGNVSVGGSGNENVSGKSTVRHAITITSGSSSNNGASNSAASGGADSQRQDNNNKHISRGSPRMPGKRSCAKVRKWREKLRQIQLMEDEKIATAQKENDLMAKENQELTARLCKLNESIAEIAESLRLQVCRLMYTFVHYCIFLGISSWPVCCSGCMHSSACRLVGYSLTYYCVVYCCCWLLLVGNWCCAFPQ
jgi:hypothetical protein